MTDLVNVVVPVLVIGFVALVVGAAVFQGIPQPEATPAATIPPSDAEQETDQDVEVDDLEITNGTVEPDEDP